MNKLISFLVCLLISQTVFAANLRVDPDKVFHRIDEKIYGHFLEHIYNSANGGLWGDLVWNRSFEDANVGQWKKEGDAIVQNGLDVDQRLTFGDSGWTDFEYTVEAKKTSGREGFLILFRVKNDKEFYWVNLGGWQNERHGIERRNADQSRQGGIGRHPNGSIETGKWYKIRVRCEGTKIEVFLDDEKILEVDDPDGPKHGQCGIGTWSTQAEFRNIEVKSLDGKTLYSELPEAFNIEQVGKRWETFGNVTAYLDSKEPLNGNLHQRLLIFDGGGGIQQSGFCLKKDEIYDVSFWVKHDPLTQVEMSPDTLIYGFKNNTTPIGSTTHLSGPSSRSWQIITSQTRFASDVDDATLYFEFRNPAGEISSICIDQISVMPLSWKEKFGGMRPDLMNAIADLRPPVIRWPGGCFASGYRWKSGIGLQHERFPYPFSIWDDREVNSFGTDEFIQLCRRVGAEPIIVINTGTPMWNVQRSPETADVDWVREACDWLEYCNGPATSKWGAIRAANGHPAPYNVKYWEIDNEIESSAEVYIETLKKFVPAMKEIDPTIKIIACGSWMGDRLRFDAPLVNEAGHLFDYLSFHQYDDPNVYATGPDEIGKYFQKLKEMITNSKNPHIKIYDSEWNAQSTDWRTGLYAGGILNMFERHGDIVEIAGPALFLRHTSANDWDNAFINFDQTGWFPAPNYVVMKLWRDHYAPNFLELTGDADGVNAVATKSDDGKRFILKAVNPTNEKKEVSLTIAGKAPKNAAMEIVQAELSDRNTLENPNKIAPQKAEVRIEGSTIKFELPPLSAGVVSCE